MVGATLVCDSSFPFGFARYTIICLLAIWFLLIWFPEFFFYKPPIFKVVRSLLFSFLIWFKHLVQRFHDQIELGALGGFGGIPLRGNRILSDIILLSILSQQKVVYVVPIVAPSKHVVISAYVLNRFSLEQIEILVHSSWSKFVVSPSLGILLNLKTLARILFFVMLSVYHSEFGGIWFLSARILQAIRALSTELKIKFVHVDEAVNSDGFGFR